VPEDGELQAIELDDLNAACDAAVQSRAKADQLESSRVAADVLGLASSSGGGGAVAEGGSDRGAPKPSELPAHDSLLQQQLGGFSSLHSSVDVTHRGRGKLKYQGVRSGTGSGSGSGSCTGFAPGLLPMHLQDSHMHEAHEGERMWLQQLQQPVQAAPAEQVPHIKVRWGIGAV